MIRPEKPNTAATFAVADCETWISGRFQPFCRVFCGNRYNYIPLPTKTA